MLSLLFIMKVYWTWSYKNLTKDTNISWLHQAKMLNINMLFDIEFNNYKILM